MKTSLEEQRIDNIVIAEADDDSAWDAPIRVRVKPHSTVELPDGLAARAAFFAQLHHQASIEEWVTSILQERIAFEEAAFAEIKHAVLEKGQVFL